jgi:hypothetical protein
MVASFAMALRYSFNRPQEAALVEQAIAAALAKGLRHARHRRVRCRRGFHPPEMWRGAIVAAFAGLLTTTPS